MTTLAEDLAKLRTLKDEAVGALDDKKQRDTEFKKHLAHCLNRMEAEQSESFRHKGIGYLFSVVEKVKGQIEDRRPYIRWALENDPAIVEFLDKWYGGNESDMPGFEDDFYKAILGTSTVEYKEKTDIMNQQARSHIDNKKPLPPGLTFRPDPNISMRKS